MRPLGRRPGPSTSREDILKATTELVSEDGIGKATIRRIAQRAGVDAAVIYRHFRDKDALFDAVFERLLASVPAYNEPITRGSDVVALALDLWEDPVRRALGMPAIRAGLAGEKAAAPLREVVTRTILRRVGTSVLADQHELRLSLMAAHLMGMVLVRHGLRLPGLAKARREEIIRAMGPVIEHYMHGDLG